MPSIGTRGLTKFRNEHPASGFPNAASTRDVGMSKYVQATMTFHATGNSVTAANGTFSAFQVGDPIEVVMTGNDQGYYTVTGIDVVNGAYLNLDPQPQAYGPHNGTIMRTI